jgi:hypothetical protein
MLGEPGKLGILEEELGRLGELGMLDEEVLGILGEELGILGAPEGLGMLGILLLLEEELGADWQPARAAIAIPRTRGEKQVDKEDLPDFPEGVAKAVFWDLLIGFLIDMLNDIATSSYLISIPRSGRLKEPEIAGQEQDQDQLSSALDAIRSTDLKNFSRS